MADEKPKKKPAKDKFIKIRVTDEERASWKTKAEKQGLTLADYLRKVADEKLTNIQPSPKVNRRKFTKADPELLRQIAWIGNNLNQIARAANQGDQTDLLVKLIEIERQVRRLGNVN